jgi:hypothetical protein
MGMDGDEGGGARVVLAPDRLQRVAKVGVLEDLGLCSNSTCNA